MKKLELMFISVLALAMSHAPSAQASDVDPTLDSRDDWSMQCRYMGNLSSGKQILSTNTCRVEAGLCSYNAKNQGTAEDPCKEGMAVNCDGNAIYNGEVFHTADSGYEFLTGKPVPDSDPAPVVKYPSAYDPTKSNFVVTSWLKIGNDILEGFCDVHNHKGGTRP